MAQGPWYPSNPAPLPPEKWIALPLGTVHPEGWLRDQLEVQARGLTGHLEEFWPSLRDSAWKGGDGEAWERGPYYLDGLVPLAYLLEDEALQTRAQVWIDWILASARPDGWFGPEENRDRWPLAVALKVLAQYYEATGDQSALNVIKNYFRWLAANPPDWPTREWRGVRAMENAVTGYWLFRRDQDPLILRVVDSIRDGSFSWTRYFERFPWDSEALAEGKIPRRWNASGLTAHVVNVAMALKYPGLIFQRTGDLRYREIALSALAKLDEHHGQAGGRFSGDEHLSGHRPTQGTELCAVVESMFSLESLLSTVGEAALGDRLEMLAYNALPGACTANLWAHQYDQQANQVLCSVAPREWSSNGDDANLYGLEPHYGCCTANLHQGWPKFAANLWMASRNGGLAAVAYGPCRIDATVDRGTRLTIHEITRYPFDGRIEFRFEVEEACIFPLYLRIPAWAHEARLWLGAQELHPAAGHFYLLKCQWQSGDRLVLEFPMELRTETRYNKAVALYRGPLLMSMKVDSEARQLKSYDDTLPVADWAFYPTAPWNYALVMDPKDPNSYLTAITDEKEISVHSVPFHPLHAPIRYRAKAIRIPGWKLEHHSAGDPPVSPVDPAQTEGPETTVELVPYASTRLRVTEMPYVLPASLPDQNPE